MRFLRFLLGLVVCGTVHAGTIRLGSLALDWPAGYQLKSARPPFELAGPQGSKVLVTVMKPGPAVASGQDAGAKLRSTLERLLTEQARKAGKVALPLGTRTLPDGTLLQFIGSEVSGLFKTGYFLQFALQSRQGQIALLTFEGTGDVAAEEQRLRGLFDSTQWEDSAAEQAAFTDRVAALLRARLGHEAVRVAEPLTLKLGDLQANLDRVFAFCRGNAQDCEAELGRYVQTVVDLHQREKPPITKGSLRAVVRTAEFVREVIAATSGKSEILQRPLTAGLVTLVVVDTQSSASVLNASEAQSLGLTAAQAFEQGLLNLRQTLKPMSQPAQGLRHGGIGTLAGEYYESSRLLFPEDWAPLAKAQAGVLIVGLPAKDLLLYSADDSPAGLEALRAQVRDVMRRSPGPLSDQLLRWSKTGWQPVP